MSTEERATINGAFTLEGEKKNLLSIVDGFIKYIQELEENGELVVKIIRFERNVYRSIPSGEEKKAAATNDKTKK